jgi:Mg-chelatase subunit ChlI
LKDRYGAQIRTHYPEDLHQEIQIMEQEALHLDMGDYRARARVHGKSLRRSPITRANRPT